MGLPESLSIPNRCPNNQMLEIIETPGYAAYSMCHNASQCITAYNVSVHQLFPGQAQFHSTMFPWAGIFILGSISLVCGDPLSEIDTNYVEHFIESRLSVQHPVQCIQHHFERRDNASIVLQVYPEEVETDISVLMFYGHDTAHFDTSFLEQNMNAYTMYNEMVEDSKFNVEMDHEKMQNDIYNGPVQTVGTRGVRKAVIKATRPGVYCAAIAIPSSADASNVGILLSTSTKLTYSHYFDIICHIVILLEFLVIGLRQFYLLHRKGDRPMLHKLKHNAFYRASILALLAIVLGSIPWVLEQVGWIFRILPYHPEVYESIQRYSQQAWNLHVVFSYAAILIISAEYKMICKIIENSESYKKSSYLTSLLMAFYACLLIMIPNISCYLEDKLACGKPVSKFDLIYPVIQLSWVTAVAYRIIRFWCRLNFKFDNIIKLGWVFFGGTILYFYGRSCLTIFGGIEAIASPSAALTQYLKALEKIYTRTVFETSAIAKSMLCLLLYLFSTAGLEAENMRPSKQEKWETTSESNDVC